MDQGSEAGWWWIRGWSEVSIYSISTLSTLISTLKPSCPGLQTLVKKKHLIKAHQLVASSLQGIWAYFLKVFLENVFLPLNALYNIMSRYNANNAFFNP